MRSKIFFILFAVTFSLLVIQGVSGQTDDNQTYGGETSDVSEVPLIGWYLVPVLGAMRRKRHDLNARVYSNDKREEIVLN